MPRHIYKLQKMLYALGKASEIWEPFIYNMFNEGDFQWSTQEQRLYL